MSRLKIRVRLLGKKNQQYVRFILVPSTVSQKGRYITKFGHCDMKRNGNTIRYVVLNIYKIIRFFMLGAKPTSQALDRIFKYFVDCSNAKVNNFFYFDKVNFLLLLESEIKKKYL